MAKLTNLVNKTGFVLDYGKQVTYMLEVSMAMIAWYCLIFGAALAVEYSQRPVA